MYNVVLVDDHTLFRNGLRILLSGSEGMKVIGEASDGEEFLALLPTLEQVDVVLLDIEMPRMNGIVAAREALRSYPDLKIITLSMYGDEDYYFRMVSEGVKGFILKNSEIQEVIQAIETVVEGGSYFSEELLATLVSNLKSTPIPESESADALSQREAEILLHICQGESNNEIAEALFISKRTVDKHRSNILSKTGCKNTANLVVYAIKNNLVEI